MSAYEARRKFGQLLEETFYQKDHFIVERSGRPMAVLVPVDDYQKWQRLSKERVFALLEEVWERTRAVPEAELEADISQALATLRREQHSKPSGEPEG
ncbi:MAG TPA: type II toxin-antitoxin system Phd/YefM family antitoxin [Caldilineaceae bacterium]|nr:type II toxin-antitoxin system Phd/YefM family antitoxin [Caldilineaceae bacterium]